MYVALHVQRAERSNDRNLYKLLSLLYFMRKQRMKGCETMTNKKYAVWIKADSDGTKQYVYASTHREARQKYAAKNSTSATECDSVKA